MNHSAMLKHSLKWLLVCAWSLLTLPLAHATQCYHQTSVHIDSSSDQSLLPYFDPKRVVQLPKDNPKSVSLHGKMRITVSSAPPGDGGDSCLLAFSAPGFGPNIGGGLTLYWGTMHYLRQDKTWSAVWSPPPDQSSVNGSCGDGFTSLDGSYKWNGAFHQTAASWGYEMYWCSYFDLFIPFEIVGVYDGSKISLEPVPVRTGPYPGSLNPDGWYSMAAGLKSKQYENTFSWWGPSYSLAPLVIEPIPPPTPSKPTLNCKKTTITTIRRH